MLTNGKLNNPEVRIETTNFCNASCVLCPREKLTRKLRVMKEGLFDKIIEESASLGARYASLFGFGEPLLDPLLVDRVIHCSKRGMGTFVTTNASKMSPDMAFKLMDAGLSDIRFSFHAIKPNDYEKIHKGLDYGMTMRNIGNFISIRNARNYPTKVHMTCIPMNGESVDDFLDLWLGRVDFLEVWKPHNWVEGRFFRKITEERKKTCGRPFNGPLQVQVDGSVIPCCFVTNSEYEYGRINSHSIVEVLTSPMFDWLKENHELGRHFGSPCDECDQLNVESTPVLLYSNRDPDMQTGKTSSTKFKLERN